MALSTFDVPAFFRKIASELAATPPVWYRLNVSLNHSVWRARK